MMKKWARGMSILLVLCIMTVMTVFPDGVPAILNTNAAAEGIETKDTSEENTGDASDEVDEEAGAGSDGSTLPVDNTTRLEDGVYTLDSFSFTGGTGKVTITCPKVTVTDGKAYAEITFSSKNYPYVKTNGRKYECSHSGSTSTVTIPIQLNTNNGILALTTAMSKDHEIEYTLYAYIAAADDAGAAQSGETKIRGLTWIGSEDLRSAKLFTIDYYEQDITAITVADVGTYLLIKNADAELPAGIEDQATIVYLPVKAAYAAAQSVYETASLLPNTVSLTGFESDDAALTYVGTAQTPDYAALLAADCDLVILPEQWSDARITGRADSTLLRSEITDEDAGACADVWERLRMIGIPAFTDRSADEESEDAAKEWIKAYGVIFSCGDEAAALYAQMIAE